MSSKNARKMAFATFGLIFILLSFLSYTNIMTEEGINAAGELTPTEFEDMLSEAGVCAISGDTKCDDGNFTGNLGVNGSIFGNTDLNIASQTFFDSDVNAIGSMQALAFFGDGSGLTGVTGTGEPLDTTLDTNGTADLNWLSTQHKFVGDQNFVDIGISSALYGDNASGDLNIVHDTFIDGDLNVLENVFATYYFGDGSKLTGLTTGEPLDTTLDTNGTADLNWLATQHKFTADQNFANIQADNFFTLNALGDSNMVNLALTGNIYGLNSLGDANFANIQANNAYLGPTVFSGNVVLGDNNIRFGTSGLPAGNSEISGLPICFKTTPGGSDRLCIGLGGDISMAGTLTNNGTLVNLGDAYFGNGNDYVEIGGDLNVTGYGTIGKGVTMAEDLGVGDLNVENDTYTGNLHVRGTTEFKGDVNAVNIEADHFYGDGSGLTGLATGEPLDTTLDTNGAADLNWLGTKHAFTADQNFTNLGVSGAIYGDNANQDLNIASHTYVDGNVIADSFNAGDENFAYQIDGTAILRTGSASNNNIFLGEDVFTNDDGIYNVGIGYHAGLNNDTTGAGDEGKFNIYIGRESGAGLSGANNTGYDNVGLGVNTLVVNTTGFGNVALGFDSMRTNSTGYSNIALGKSTLYTNSTGRFNVAIGVGSMYLNDTGHSNVALGRNSLNANVGSFGIVAIGEGAGLNTTGGENTFIGRRSGYLNTSGASNLFLGYKSGYNQTTNSNLLIIDNQDRGSDTNETASSLIYGVFDSDPSDQTLRFNADVNITNDLNVAGDINVVGSIQATAFYGSGIGITGLTTGEPLDTTLDTNGAADLNWLATQHNFTADQNFTNTSIENIYGDVNFTGSGGNFTFDESTGYVGIGTTKPAEFIHMYTVGHLNVKYEASGGGNDALINILGPDDAFFRFSKVGADVWALGNDAGDSDIFKLCSGASLCNDPVLAATTSTKYIGIGTKNPTHKLNVAGDVNITGDTNIMGDLNVTGDVNIEGMVTAAAFVGDGTGLTGITTGEPLDTTLDTNGTADLNWLGTKHSFTADVNFAQIEADSFFGFNALGDSNIVNVGLTGNIFNLNSLGDANFSFIQADSFFSFNALGDANMVNVEVTKIYGGNTNLDLNIMSETHIDNRVNIRGDLNITSPNKHLTGVSISADANRICFPSEECQFILDWNGEAFVMQGA